MNCKGKYIYYHYNNAKKLDKSKPLIREDRIEAKFVEFLKELCTPPEEFIQLKNVIKTFVNQGCDYIEQKTVEIKHRIDVLNRRISKLYDDRMDGNHQGRFLF